MINDEDFPVLDDYPLTKTQETSSGFKVSFTPAAFFPVSVSFVKSPCRGSIFRQKLIEP